MTINIHCVFCDFYHYQITQVTLILILTFMTFINYSVYKYYIWKIKTEKNWKNNKTCLGTKFQEPSIRWYQIKQVSHCQKLSKSSSPSPSLNPPVRDQLYHCTLALNLSSQIARVPNCRENISVLGAGESQLQCIIFVVFSASKFKISGCVLNYFPIFLWYLPFPYYQ